MTTQAAREPFVMLRQSAEDATCSPAAATDEPLLPRRYCRGRGDAGRVGVMCSVRPPLPPVAISRPRR